MRKSESRTLNEFGGKSFILEFLMGGQVSLSLSHKEKYLLEFLS